MKQIGRRLLLMAVWSAVPLLIEGGVYAMSHHFVAASAGRLIQRSHGVDVVVHVYDVRGLVITIPDFCDSFPLFQPAPPRSGWIENVRSLATNLMTPSAWRLFALCRTRQDAVDCVTGIVTTVVAPGTWGDSSNAATARDSTRFAMLRELSGQLIVMQSPRNQRNVAMVIGAMIAAEWCLQNSPYYYLPWIGVTIVWITWRRFRRRWWQRARSGCCVGCGYDLRATPARCPECGRQAADVEGEALLFRNRNGDRRAAGWLSGDSRSMGSGRSVI